MYDVIIIGGGPAGLNAGLYSSRSGLKTIMFERLFVGGQAATTSEIDNYIGVSKTDGPTLCMQMAEQAMSFGLEISYNEILEIDYDKKIVKTKNKDYEAKGIILAMGAKPRKLEIVGEDEFLGRGVSYCATCDGNFYKDKVVSIIGGGDTALEDAVYLSNICKKVYLIHRRSEFRGNNTLFNSVKEKENIEMILNTVCKEIKGEDSVNKIMLENAKTNETLDLETNGVFIAVGTIPNAELIKECIKTKNGYILTDENMRTNVKNIYAAGDIRDKSLRQIITAVADGAIASKSILDDIMQK